MTFDFVIFVAFIAFTALTAFTAFTDFEGDLDGERDMDFNWDFGGVLDGVDRSGDDTVESESRSLMLISTASESDLSFFSLPIRFRERLRLREVDGCREWDREEVRLCFLDDDDRRLCPFLE